MAVNEKRIQVTELDFDDIKNNLKSFLKGQSEFTDYDFEGSGMNILLDTLAYNTHYLAYNANMAVNESFLDTATQRNSVVSHAKTLGYTPRSARAPVAYVDVRLNDNTLTSATIEKGYVFTTTVNEQNYTFVVNESFSVTKVDGLLQFRNVPIYEGTLITSKQTVDTSDESQKFILTDNRADTTTLKVSVQNSASDTTTTSFYLATDITQVGQDSDVYFIQEISEGRFEVYFGDGVVGKALSNGNIVILEYIVTNKASANGARTFKPSGAIATVTDLRVSTVAAAIGGTEPETITSIKYNAPLDYASQGRAVTGRDYKTLVPTVYPAASSVQVWGGEDNDPPSYGSVYIAIKTKNGTSLTEAQKQSIVTSLRQYNVASIRPTIVDPETTFLRLTTTFSYDERVTTKTAADLETIVRQTITNYNAEQLRDFEGIFRHSKITSLIDNSDPSITSNITTIKMSKRFTPRLNTTAQYILKFSNALYHPHNDHNAGAGGVIASSGFNISGQTNTVYIDDDGSGNVRLFYLIGGQTRSYIDNTFGTVNYTTGEIVIPSANITAISNVDNAASTTIRVSAVPNSNDIVPVRNQIIEIDLGNTAITGQVDTIISGSSTGANYTTATSISNGSLNINSGY